MITAGPNMMADKLVLHLDAKNTRSYPGYGETWYDISGNGYNSTINGASFVSSSGHFSFAGQGERDGDPTGDYLDLNTNATTTSPSVRTDGVTYIFWIKFDGEQDNGHGLFGKSTINHLEWRGTIDSGYFRTEAKFQNGYSFGANPVPSGYISTGIWFNIAIVFANNEVDRPVYWYINGDYFFAGDMTSGTSPDTECFNPLFFGRSTGSGAYLYAQSFKGCLGMLSIYDKSLTKDEIRSIFNATRGRYSI